MTSDRSPDPVLIRIRSIQAEIAAGRLDVAAAALAEMRAAAPADARVQLAGAMLAVANPRAAGDAESELHHLRTALALSPTNPAIQRELGLCLGSLGRNAEAEPHWRAVLAASPEDASALGWLGICLVGLGRREEGRAALERAVALWPDNPSLGFHLAIARGETPRTQPAAMLEQMFDAYAPRFDRHLVGHLKYRVPRRVAAIIRTLGPVDALSVLDLGCGTGLLGAYLGRIGGAFVGVDLSAKMLDQAARHEVYTALRHAELLEELRRTASASYACVAANDVFIYVGDVGAVIPEAFRVLRSGGALVFSCEHADDREGAFVLRASKRYAHSRASIAALCRDAGFAGCEFESIELRFDTGAQPIAGYLAVARRS